MEPLSVLKMAPVTLPESSVTSFTLSLIHIFAAGSIQLIDPMNDYIDSILKMVDAEAIRSRGLHVVLDPMYGVSKTALQTILLTTRCDVEVIHERRDTLFGGRLPAPNLKTLAGLTNYVEEHGCDIGIATDGDADRLGVIDDKAEFLQMCIRDRRFPVDDLQRVIQKMGVDLALQSHDLRVPQGQLLLIDALELIFQLVAQDVYKRQVYFKNGGWVIARFSGTEPLLRVF